MVVFAALFGTLIGTKLFHLVPRLTLPIGIKMFGACQIILILFGACFLIHCPNREFYGLTEAQSHHDPPYNVNDLTAECSLEVPIRQ